MVEEVKVGKTATERTETVRDTVKHTEVEVENDSVDRGAGFGARNETTQRYAGVERRVRSNPDY